MASCVRAETCRMEVVKHKIYSGRYYSHAFCGFIIMRRPTEKGDYLKMMMISVYTCMYVCVCMYVCMYLCMYACVCVCVVFDIYHYAVDSEY
jgi:hypothetical protein